MPDTVTLDPLGVLNFGVYGLTATGDSVPVDVQWTSSAGSITPSGQFIADSSESDVDVTATLSGGAVVGSARVRKHKIIEIIVRPHLLSLLPGQLQQFTTLGVRDNGDTVLVSPSYTVAPAAGSSGTGGTVTASGLFTAGATAGNYLVIAARQQLADTAWVTIANAAVASVSVSPAASNLFVGTSTQLTATLRDASGNILTARSITWTSSAPSVASVSVSGMVTALAPGSATITATSEGQSGSATITVTVVPVAAVTVAPSPDSLTAGATVQLTATTKDSANNVLSGRIVTWSSSAAGVATVSATGLVTAVGAGSATITATSEGKNGTATITVTVPVVPVATVTVSPATKTLRIGTTVQLAATTKDSAGTVLTGRAITWTSNATGVATVSASGLVTAVAAGSATITATSEGKSGTSAITVTVVPVATVTVSPATGTLNIGATLQLTAVTKDSAGNVLTGRVVTWSSSATGLATVSSAGLVTSLAAGSVTITATSEGKSGSSAITVSATTQGHSGRFVSPAGSSSGDGTMAKPWDLATALSGAGGKILPGDTVWLRGGTYNGSFTSSLRGTAAAPIVVRQYPGERATLDGTSSTSITLNVDGQWTIYWGFEIKNTITTRFSSGLAARPSGVYVRNATNVKLVNLIIHDTGHGTYIENTAHSIEIYGWIVYNGGNDNPSRSDGHGIYVRNDGTTQKVIADNIVFNQFGFGIHSYAESGDLLKNIKFEGNVLFNNSSLSSFVGPNMILGGETVADNDTIRNNFYYFSPGRGARNLRLGYTTQQNASADVEGNYIVGGTTEAIDVTLWSNLRFWNNTLVETGRVLAFADANTAAYDWNGNTHYRDTTAKAWGFGGTDYKFTTWQQSTGLGAGDRVPSATPSAPAVFVRPNKYEPGRANVIVYNWGRQSSVSADLSNVLAPGQRFEIRNVQDLWGTAVVSGTYGGGSVTIPMGGVAPPQPVGGSTTAPVQTGPDFDVFVVFPLP
ncbi:MAG TPA: Ig-like domain-containing protein [Gemmatimonadales bacterium]|nr:Ig-like domain-containing protein [Gemmatimonadales bacterium]